MPRQTQQTARFDPVELELFNNRLISVAEEMGSVLGQSGYSPNITERGDYSCALFDADGRMVTHAAHIPVHLGSTPLSVQAAIEAVTMEPGDVIMLNDPFAGGTHLPDITAVAPVFTRKDAKLLGFVANRAHHADIGGQSPGSMALSREIHQEGLRIPPVHIVRHGEVVRETLELFLANTRVHAERRGDLEAQLSSLNAGISRVAELCSGFGERTVRKAMGALQSYSERRVRKYIRGFPAGSFFAEDVLDDDGFGNGPIPICVTVTRTGRALRFDFTGTAGQVEGPLNANLAITTSAVFYVLACVLGKDVPANSGMMDCVEIVAPEGTVVNCCYPAAVAGGNVETSQRIVDVLLRALSAALPEQIPASSAGSMSNLTIGGYDSIRDRFFSYYETIAGGAGAGPGGPGASAVQTHMTNTFNSPVEVLEAYYPFTVRKYAVRRRSGGRGAHAGGDGIVREIEILEDAAVTLLAERRSQGAPGQAGGESGRPGADRLIKGDGKRQTLPSKSNTRVSRHTRVRIETPGGGGWGLKAKRTKNGDRN